MIDPKTKKLSYSEFAKDRQIPSPAYTENLDDLLYGQLNNPLSSIVLGLSPEPISQIYETVNQSVTFADSVGIEKGDTGSSTITFSDEATFSRVYHISVEDHLSIFQYNSELEVFDRVLESTVVFAQDPYVLRSRTISADNTLSFIDEAIKLTYAIDSITFSDIGDVAGIKKNLGTNITINNAVSLAGSVWSRSTTDTLTFLNAILLNGIRSRTATNEVTFVNQVIKSVVKRRSLESSITFTDEAVRVFLIDIEHSLTFDDSITKSRVLPRQSSNILTFENEVSRQIVRSLVINQTFNVKNGNNVLGYNVPGGQAIIPYTYVVLQTNSGLLKLKRPRYGNVESLNVDLKIHKSINNKVYTYLRRNNAKRLKYTFEVYRSKKEEITQFLVNSSELIVLTTWEGEVWLCKLLNNPIEFTNTRVGTSGDMYTFDFEFEGVQIA